VIDDGGMINDAVSDIEL